ncbi:MAG: phosphatase PAP2 family protein [Chloroflexi bacterium]|nr:MAG: phosphatase PAP2 family protein [Chloroflexota bacterium]
MRQRLLTADMQLSAWLGGVKESGCLRLLAVILAHSGDSWFWLAGLGMLWWVGDDYWRFRAGVFLIGIVITAVLVMLMKLTVRRERPEGDWGGFYRRTDPHSFPSGHAARSIALAVMALSLGPPWLGLVLLAWAPLVSLARVALGVHYVSDVIIGGILGLLTGALSVYIVPIG